MPDTCHDAPPAKLANGRRSVTGGFGDVLYLFILPYRKTPRSPRGVDDPTLPTLSLARIAPPWTHIYETDVCRFTLICPLFITHSPIDESMEAR